MADRPRIAVVFTGGTISMLPDPLTGAAVPALDGAAILERVPGLEAIADLRPIDWGLVPASHLRFSQILEIGTVIADAAERCAQYYMNHRWLGGTLTNWQTIRERIHELERLEGRPVAHLTWLGRQGCAPQADPVVALLERLRRAVLHDA